MNRIDLNKKIVIAVAPVCHAGNPIPEGCYNPLTPHEVALEVETCEKAGASMVHLHTRNELGEQVEELDCFTETLDLIRKKSNIVIQGSTGGLSTLTLDQRCTSLNEPRVEVASLNMGSVNFFNESVYINTIPDIRYWAKRMIERVVVPEMEIFDLSMITTCKKLMNENLIPSSAYFSLCMGFEGALPATVENMLCLKSFLPKDAVWGVVHDDMEDFSMLAAAVVAGARFVRVGFEDSFYYAKGELAKSNTELVERVAAIIRGIGYEVASTEEAREILLR